jgi:hypothetical protein
LADPDLNDPQILLLRLAHGMLVDTETYIDCRYRYWPSPRCPRDGRRLAEPVRAIDAGLPDSICALRQQDEADAGDALS